MAISQTVLLMVEAAHGDGGGGACGRYGGRDTGKGNLDVLSASWQACLPCCNMPRRPPTPMPPVDHHPHRRQATSRSKLAHSLLALLH